MGALPLKIAALHIEIENQPAAVDWLRSRIAPVP
jgi:hypothetical protein